MTPSFLCENKQKALGGVFFSENDYLSSFFREGKDASFRKRYTYKDILKFRALHFGDR